MPQKLSNIQVAEMLTNQLSGDLSVLDEVCGYGNEPSFSQKEDSYGKSIIQPNDILSNSGNIVNDKFYESAKTAELAGDWDEPIPLESSNTVIVPAFPIHCLPEVLADYTLAIAEHTQTSIDMSAVASLGASSACLQGKYLVQGKIGYTVPLNNYYVEVAKPGERKSAICAVFEEPIKAYEKRHNETFALEIAQSMNIKQVLEKEMEALKNEVAKGKGKKTYADIEAKQAEINAHQEIKPLRLTCGGDVSPEALTSLLADNNGKMAMFSAEGGIFSILQGMYSKSANIDTILQAQCGDTIMVDRKGRPRESIENPCLTMLLFIFHVSGLKPPPLGGIRF